MIMNANGISKVAPSSAEIADQDSQGPNLAQALASQRIVRVRRDYNQWVANETLEDYSLRFTAKTARKWSCLQVANTALGAISFLALEAIGAAITLSYGFTNAAWAILVVSIVIFISGAPISYYAAKYGVDMDLLTRGAGFGYIGSTITSLIYATFTFIFFAIEAAIMALALEMLFGLPLAAGYLVSSLAVIPLVLFGITFISRFQAWTQPWWLLLHILPFVFVWWKNPSVLADWPTFAGRLGDASGQFDWLLFGAASSVVFSLIVQIGEQVDFLRFLPRDTTSSKNGKAVWWVALIGAGPGWIILGALKMLAGSFLAFLALQHEVSPEKATEPTQMYLVAFQYVFPDPATALLITVIFVVLSQLKINVTNAYAGSIAWSNFFARLTHSHPGRVVWLVFNVLIAVLLMELGVFRAFEQILGIYSIVAIAWVGALFADLVINKPLGLSPRRVEFKRAHLFNVNPVGVGSMTVATVLAGICYTGFLGPMAQALTSFVALGAALVSAPLIAWGTGGRYYIARQSNLDWKNLPTMSCIVCENAFETEDMAHCPAYGGGICSLCCSLDARCHDRCKPSSAQSFPGIERLRQWVPARWRARLNPRLGKYVLVMGSLLLLMTCSATLIYLQEVSESTLPNEAAFSLLVKVFSILTIISGVVAWLFVLMQESSRVAMDESSRQTTLLMQEIDAHKQTDALLQRAKEASEAANLAKSRFVTGVSHELRTPLNSILGYAQLLERDEAVVGPHREAVRVIRRSSDHLSSLIDGLLDIARIEAGKVFLNRDKVALRSFLDDLLLMFEPQARAAGLKLDLQTQGRLPQWVRTDEKRLRQILINLLSNALKFTQHGQVTLRAIGQGQLIVLQVHDTGPGVDSTDLERIFQPFERGKAPSSSHGTGLGLTICKLLTEILGGELIVESTLGKGSTFSVRMHFEEIMDASQSTSQPSLVRGYLGARRSILVVDDDQAHRSLVDSLLSPIGFELCHAENCEQARQFIAAKEFDAILLDVGLPDGSGWDIAAGLRVLQSGPAIIMISANAFDAQNVVGTSAFCDRFLIKPFSVDQLLDQLRESLRLQWELRPAFVRSSPSSIEEDRAELIRRIRGVSNDIRTLLSQSAAIGYVDGVSKAVDALPDQDQPLVRQLRLWLTGYQFQKISVLMQEAGNDH
jgi:signal transduction histidine kinase/DNA-binding response OmpR family regulator/purine-cytosine permease-like protein